MRIFVAGASGVIGRLLVPLLVAEGHEVTALSRRERPVADGVRTVVADVYDAAALRTVVAAARPEVVIHQLTDLGSRDFAANIRIRREGTRNLVDAALAAGARRVISQSIAWAYEPGDTPAVESTPLDLNATDAGRRASVQAVAELEAITAEAPEWVVLRYGMLYGPNTWYTAGGLMADLATTGNLPAGPDITSFLHTQDAAQAAASALHWPTGPVNIVDNTPAPATTWLPTFTTSVTTPTPPTLHNPPSTPSAPSAPHEPPAAPSALSADAPAGAPTSTLDPTRTPWARGASNAYARTRLGWSPIHPTWQTGFTS